MEGGIHALNFSKMRNFCVHALCIFERIIFLIVEYFTGKERERESYPINCIYKGLNNLRKKIWWNREDHFTSLFAPDRTSPPFNFFVVSRQGWSNSPGSGCLRFKMYAPSHTVPTEVQRDYKRTGPRSSTVRVAQKEIGGVLRDRHVRVYLQYTRKAASSSR